MSTKTKCEKQIKTKSIISMDKLFGKSWNDVSSFENFVKYMYRPTDPSSLGVIRFFYGFLMLLDISEERGGSEIDLRWGEPRDCHFPLIPFIRPMSLPYMGLVYGFLWIGALGIMLGYKFRLSTTMFLVPYWYLFLIDKSFWNNHSYLFGICAILLVGTNANCYFSIDGLLDKKKRNSEIQFWNYFILKVQFFLLYFLAGLKKTDIEWLEGYAMTNLSRHWVFDPFKLFLTIDQIDFLIVHWFGFIFDLTVGFWMLFDLTRPYAMVFCVTFHIMNSRLFSIGMFPYVCLATLPLFCSVRWPRKLEYKFKKIILKQKAPIISKPQPNTACIYDKKTVEKFKNKIELKSEINWKHRLVVCLLLTHCGLQLFLPYSHFITKGYNNWTNGLYGYSWDMMVHAWDTILVVVKVVDNKSQREHFLDPEAWTLNDRWTKHGDMMYQYAYCLKENLINEYKQLDDINKQNPNYLTSENISIYIDVWCSLNGRFQQRMFNPNYDLLNVNWNPFKPIEWLMPLLSEFSGWRTDLTEIQKHVYSWSNYSDVIFVADFPGLYLENYISPDLSNVSLTVLEGEVFLEMEDLKRAQSTGQKLYKGMFTPIRAGEFHKVHTTSTTPASYMYTYINQTKMETDSISQTTSNKLTVDDQNYYPMKSPFPLIEDISLRIENMKDMFQVIINSILNILHGVPMVRRVKIYD